jgi:chromosomal replication initiation ATPase DnaA
MTPTELLKTIEEETGVTLKEIQSESRKEKLVYARRIIAHYMLKDHHSVHTIADILHRHRTTVINIRATHETEYRYNPRFRTLFDTITKRLTAPPLKS